MECMRHQREGIALDISGNDKELISLGEARNLCRIRANVAC